MTNSFIKRYIFEQNLKQKRIDKLYSIYQDDYSSFCDIINKIIKKYSSDKYTEKEYKCGYKPRKRLFWILNKFFEQYGREANSEECKEYTNSFTASIYFFNDYVSIIDCGQGSEIYIYKINE